MNMTFGEVVREIIDLSEEIDLAPASVRGSQQLNDMEDELKFLMNSVLAKHWGIKPGCGSPYERGIDEC